VALYIAAIMYVSMVSTALVLHVSFAALGITPESARVVEEVSRFAIDYTFWLNLVMVGLAAWLVWLHRRFLREEGAMEMEMEGGGSLKRGVAYLAATVLVVGAGVWRMG